MPQNAAIKTEEVIYPSMREVLSKIPKEYFKPDLSKSFLYLFSSIFFTTLFALIQFSIIKFISSPFLFYPLLIVNGFFLGTSFLGLWSLGHDCGHNTFSGSKYDDALGFILHLVVFCPYFGWKRSHYFHHSGLGHVDLDADFKPFNTFSFMPILKKIKSLIGDNIFSLLFIGFFFSVGWFYYFLVGLPGKMNLKSHIYPHKDIFPERLKIIFGGISYLALLSLVIYSLINWTFISIFMYIFPLSVFSIWMVVYIMVQHLSDGCIWATDTKEWKIEKSVFQTTDTKFYSFTNFLHHNIARYHLFHHVSARIPHYYGKEVTKIIEVNYPHLYRYTDKNPLVTVFLLGKNILQGEMKENGDIVIKL